MKNPIKLICAALAAVAISAHMTARADYVHNWYSRTIHNCLCHIICINNISKYR